MPAINYDIANLQLADLGQNRILWSDQQMPVLQTIRKRFSKEQPLRGQRITACLHVTTEAANLLRTLKAGGAKIALCASNPVSTQDDVAAALIQYYDIEVFAVRGEDNETYYKHIHQALNIKPTLLIDDGADAITTVHNTQLNTHQIIGGTEETTTGVIRLRAMARENKLKFPIIAVNDARTKYLFDNRYGTGQSTVDGILRATNILLAGRVCILAGYGWCGRGIAMRMRGMGARVIIMEIDPVKALEATLEGFQVLPMDEAVKIGDLFITATGNKHVITYDSIQKMKDGVILANSGHFNVEIDVATLEKQAKDKKTIRPCLEEYTLPSGKHIYLLAEGRLINLASGEGHPAVVMDMSFANQALSLEYLAQNGPSLENKVYPVPDFIDNQVATLKLEALGIHIDQLTEEQKQYLQGWTEGT